MLLPLVLSTIYFNEGPIVYLPTIYFNEGAIVYLPT